MGAFPFLLCGWASPTADRFPASSPRRPTARLLLSGVGYQAGGPDYLLQFIETRVVTEQTLRRGFASSELAC